MNRDRNSGFSLVEILVVLVIMGLLISVVAPTVLNRADEARVQKAQADFKAIETALKIYRLDNYVYPTTEQGLQALVEPSSLDPVPRNFKKGGYLPELPLDPWGRPYLYLSPGENGEVDIYTLGADGLSGGEDQNADIGNWKSTDD
ncbi:type II secretion system protein GspG [Seongchinamella sediminis]|uniref:Type II secretion system core protein G n=1 Tax=Seongchinamella sediminis TaxID=2283635 RepID=A0A3L7E1P6_9GAMM|nr:type II secretion system major pseudopilin GspG [Seongchinamella sediminis]RLQ23768.1 type II secretion system protein GspG [Seongchinamella sediminis]